MPADAVARLAETDIGGLAPAERVELSLLLGSAHQAADMPGMLAHLGRAWTSPAATPGHRLVARREAARHLLRAGFAREALALLADEAAWALAPADLALTCGALGALAKMDLGLGAEVARGTRDLVARARPVAPRLCPRDRAWLVNDLLQLLLSQLWLSSGRPFALSAQMAVGDLDTPPALRQCLNDVLSFAARQDLPASHEVQVLCALAQATIAPAQRDLAADLLALAVPAATTATAQLWTWLGLGNQIVQNRRVAIGCHRQALVLAQRTGAHRVARLSTAELASLLAEDGDIQGAYNALCRCRVEQARLQAQSDLPMAQRWLGAQDGRTQTPPPAACPRPASLHVQRARLYIGAQVSKQLAIADVARACGVSRRTLELAFRTTLNCSVADFLRRARIASVTARLQLADDAVHAIAADLGYASVNALNREFRRHTGQTVHAYRQALAWGGLNRLDANE